MFNAGETGKTGIGNTVNIISASLLKTVKAVMHSFMAAFFVEKTSEAICLSLVCDVCVCIDLYQAQTLHK
jgi:hypothetical protein